MSVRATGALIAEIVSVSGMANSPQMVVQAVDPDNKTVTTVWFSDAHEAQQGVFPAASLDRVVAPPVVAAKPPRSTKRK